VQTRTAESKRLSHLLAYLPSGRALPPDVWRRRHAAILILLWLHAAGITWYALVTGNGWSHSLFEATPIIAAALLAGVSALPRRLRALIATLGLISCSTLLVHLSGGFIELHFHFFVMVVVIALYQDWLVFLFAVAYVVLHHGVIGALYPAEVYNHPDAWAHPWRWAAIHGIFVLAISAAALVNWRIIEGAHATADAATSAHAREQAARAAAELAQRRLAVQYDASRVLAECVTVEEVAPQILAVIGRGFDWDLGTFWILDREAESLTCVATWELAPGWLPDFVPANHERSASTTALIEHGAWVHGVPEWCHDVAAIRTASATRLDMAQPGTISCRLAFPIRTRSGVIGLIECFAQRWLPPDGDQTKLAATLGRQIGERLDRQAVEEAVRHRAFHDALTDLPNRTSFAVRLEEALARAERETTRLAVLFLDLDGFKLINDSLGHAAGDDLLTALAERLAGELGPSCTLARLGGDEFTVLIEGLSVPAEAAQVAERLRDAVRRPFVLGEHEVFVSISIGVALSEPDQHKSAGDLLRTADIAMYRAKAAGKDQTVCFDEVMQTEAVARLALATELHQAVERDELKVYYQPEVELGSGRIVGVEALVRWQHPIQGVVSPAQFIPFAEESGLITTIGRHVLRQACRQAHTWQQWYPDQPLLVTVNLSARELCDQTLVDDVTTILNETGLAPTSLRLEITESAALADIEKTIATLTALRALGVRLAVDDFGTGYSSLSHLRQLPFDTVKIDRSFVRGIDRDAEAAAIVQAVTALAHALRLDVTAEGVETEAELVEVTRLGCDRVQGFLVGRPAPPSELDTLFRTGRVAPLVATPPVTAAALP
jgi:diguanylate cyclase (GGDEF)-like protein